MLHVGKYYPPFAAGIEHFMSDLLPALCQKGLGVSALVHNHRMSLMGNVRSLSVAGTTEHVRAHRSVQLYRAPCLGQLLYSPVSPQFPYWLDKVIKRERPQILHLHMPNTSAFWALFMPAARRIPWVVHWHADVVSSRFDRRLGIAYGVYRPFEDQVLRRAQVVVATSPPYLESSRTLEPWRAKCCVVPLGVDSARIPNVPRASRQWADSQWGKTDFRILSVGRLTYYKGYEYLIRAMNVVPDARLIIVGDGQRRRFLQALIDESGLHERVTLAGRLSSDSMHALMNTCQCFCLPSIERTEAFGMVLLEAMAHSKPAVVSDIPGSGVSWVVRDGVTGRVVPPADPPSLAHALRELSSDRERLAAMGEQAHQRYQRNFRITSIAEQIARLYNDVREHGEERQVAK